MVPVDESEVYETVLPMCGPDYHLDRPDDESGTDASDGVLGSLPWPSGSSLSASFSPLLERLSHVCRRM